MPVQRRSRAALAQHEAPSAYEVPDFDFVDMLWGFPVAVSAAHLNIPAVAVTALAFVAQKALRTNPAVKEYAGAALGFALHLLPMPDGMRQRLPAPRPELAQDVDEEEDRALARAALDVARKRVEERPDDTSARAKLERLEGQARALYPDLLGDDDDQPMVAVHPNRDPLFAALEERPHQLVIGHTGGGKTTLLHELATGWAAAGQNVMVCDPDAAPGQWPGCRVVGGGDDFDAIYRVLQRTHEIVEDRKRQRKAGRRAHEFKPIRLVIDESADVVTEIPVFWEIAEPILRRGRKLGVHLTMGVQDNQVDTLDLEGKSHLMKNMSIVDLYKEPDGTRVATFGKGKQRRSMTVPQLRDPEMLIVQPALAVAARPAVAPAPAALGETEKLPKPVEAFDALLADLLAQAPPKQEQPTATATIERDGTTINVYAQASAPAATGRNYTRKATGPNVRQRAQKLKGQCPQQPEDLSAVYVGLAHLKFDDAWEAAGKRPSNRNKAHQIWKAARGR